MTQLWQSLIPYKESKHGPLIISISSQGFCKCNLIRTKKQSLKLIHSISNLCRRIGRLLGHSDLEYVTLSFTNKRSQFVLITVKASEKLVIKNSKQNIGDVAV